MFAAFQSFLDGPVDVDRYYGFQQDEIETKIVQLPPQSIKTKENSQNNKIQQYDPSQETQGSIMQTTPHLHSQSMETLSNMNQTQIGTVSLSAFDRLYYSGLQRKASRERQTKQMMEIRNELELTHLQPGPKISLISVEVAKTMNYRNNAENFIEFSLEWQKQRDQKIQQAKMQQEARLIEEAQPLFKPSSKHLPKDYKGPVTGYYDRVNKFFENKMKTIEIGSQKLNAIPKINKRSRSRTGGRPSEDSHKNNKKDRNDHSSVEERLLKKGQEYKQNINLKRHEAVQEMIQEGPMFQPQLISNNDLYLKNQKFEEQEKIKSQVGIGNHLYYEAMVFLMNKQTRIIENQKLEQMNHRIPEINGNSLKIISSISRKPLYRDPKTVTQNQEVINKPPIDEKQKKEILGKIQSFIKRNYEKEIKIKAQKNSRAAQDLQAEKQLMQLGSTFKPQLSNKTMDLMSQRKRKQPTFEDLYSEAKRKLQRKQEKIEKRQRELQDQEMEGVTFKPQIQTNHFMRSTQQSESTPQSYQMIEQQNKQQKSGQKHKKQATQYKPNKVNSKQSSSQSYMNMYGKPQQQIQTFFQHEDISQIITNKVNIAQNKSVPHIFIIEDSSKNDSIQNIQINNQTDNQISNERKNSNEFPLEQRTPIIQEDFERRRSSALNKTMESNLLDFNEEKFFEDTKSMVYNPTTTNRSSRSSSVNNTQNKKDMAGSSTIQTSKFQMHTPTHQPASNNDVIEGFLLEMQNANRSISQPLEKVIEEAKRAIMEFEQNEKSDEDHDEVRILEKSYQKPIIMPSHFQAQKIDIDALLSSSNNSQQNVQVKIKRIVQDSPKESTPKQCETPISDKSQNSFQENQEAPGPLEDVQVQPFQVGAQNNVQVLMNKSLSRIDEEIDEEHTINEESIEQSFEKEFTQRIDERAYQENFQTIYTEASLIPLSPGIIGDIEMMERDFRNFLEIVYN